MTVPPSAAPSASASAGRLGLAYTCFVVRMLHGRDIVRAGTAAGLPAETLVDLTHAFGAAGCQIDLSQLAATEGPGLHRLREALEARGLFVELSVPARAFEEAEQFARCAAVARELGATRLRVALLMGRRYEDFQRREDWTAFAARWRAILPRAAGWLEGAGLVAGIENHKDFLARELADLLRSVDSPHLGACVDLGNNLALLEAAEETVETLAPHAVSVHLKDMAVRPTADGFELSEVPLGTGLLPLRSLVDRLRRARPDAAFCLEMITRDPLPVPYLEDRYWATREGRDSPRVQAFEAAVLSKAWTAPLPRITGQPPAAMLAAEDANVRASVAYAKEALGL